MVNEHETGTRPYYYSFRSPGKTGDLFCCYNNGLTANESLHDIIRWANVRYHDVKSLSPISGWIEYPGSLVYEANNNGTLHRGWDRHCKEPLYEGEKVIESEEDLDKILEFPFRVRPSVCSFIKFMEYKLQKKDSIWGESWKEGDEKENPMFLLRRLREETDELQAELEKYYSDVQSNELEIALECADVANFAMMIQDIILMEREER